MYNQCDHTPRCSHCVSWSRRQWRVDITPVEDSFGVAPVHLVHTKCVPRQCGVVLTGLLQGAKDGESLYFQLLSSEL